MIASHMSDTSKAAPVFARNPFRLIALLPILASLVIPASAWADIYKWTDEQGRINISNVPPPESSKVKNVEIILKETKPTAIPDHVATPTEQALLARIKALERQQQQPQSAARPPAVPPPMPYPGNYPQAPLPPPPSYYDYGYDSGYDSSDYLSDYPIYYPGYYYPTYAYPVYPARGYTGRSGFGGSRGGVSRGGGGGGRGWP